MFATNSPSLSPNGDKAVLSSPVTGHGDLYLVSTKTGQSQRLTHTDKCELSPYFLPGTRRVVFCREEVPWRHIWLLDLETGQERQLTRGSVLDDIAHVSPNGASLIVYRSTNWGMGRAIHPFLLDIATGQMTQLAGFIYARFSENGNSLLATRIGTDTEDYETVRASLAGNVVQIVAKGSASDTCEESKLAVLTGPFSMETSPDSRLACLDLQTGQRHELGLGHSARVFPNGKVLFFVGYQDDAYIWEQGTGERRAIASPAGYKVFPNRASGSARAGVYIMPRQQPQREYELWIFDSETEQFEHVALQITK
jgi:hypothetical protein